MRNLILISALFYLVSCQKELEPIDVTDTSGFVLSDIQAIKTPYTSCFASFSIKNSDLLKLPDNDIKDAILEGFENWQATDSSVFFREANSGEAGDIEIKFDNNSPQIFTGKSTENGLLRFPVNGILSDIRFSQQKPFVTFWLNSAFSWNKAQLKAVVSFLVGRAYGLKVSGNAESILQNDLSKIAQLSEISIADGDSLRKVVSKNCKNRVLFFLRINTNRNDPEYFNFTEIKYWDTPTSFKTGILFDSSSPMPNLSKSEKDLKLSDWQISGLSSSVINGNYLDSLYFKPQTTYIARPYFYVNQSTIIYGKRIRFKTR